jgi:hypothetical protein
MIELVDRSGTRLIRELYRRLLLVLLRRKDFVRQVIVVISLIVEVHVIHLAMVVWRLCLCKV